MFESLGQYFLLPVSILLWGVFKTEPQTYLKPSMEGLILVLFQWCYMDCGSAAPWGRPHCPCFWCPC